MNLDIRYPIGGMFSIFGVVLIAYGLVSSPAIYERSLGINVNLWWGIVLLLFGLVMLWLAHRAARAVKDVGQTEK
ncbi:MAG TPA: hypothetical protein VL549_12400 [Gemmatimonadales bacterium]|jgi:protein-S-isoprenylcysteine O-methyltransferase Ste14|nr:hypothetical protein [Gemmatimonadales bacterium]